MAESPFATLDRAWVLLDDPETARRWLTSLGVRDVERGFRDLRDLARRGASARVLAKLATALHALLPRCPDPGMALTNLERFVAANPRPEAALEGLVDDPRALEILLQLFSTSQHFSELIIRDPTSPAWLRDGAERRDRDDPDRRALGLRARGRRTRRRSA